MWNSFTILLFLSAFSTVLYGERVARRAEENYKAPPATLDAISTCSADNWGMPHQKRPPYHTTYTTNIQKACQAVLSKENMKPISEVLSNATVNHYLNNKDFDDFKGMDLVPDNHNLYSPNGLWGKNLDYKHVRRDFMRAATCENQLEDGSTWTVTKIGPMKTRVITLFQSHGLYF